jgi:hypothetical protein
MPRNDEELRGPSRRSRCILKREWTSRMGEFCVAVPCICVVSSGLSEHQKPQRVSLRWTEWVYRVGMKRGLETRNLPFIFAQESVPLNGSVGAWYLLIKIRCFRMHLDLRVSRSWVVQTRGVKARCIVAFSGVWVSGSMDRANLESFDLKGYTSIDVRSVMMCIAD